MESAYSGHNALLQGLSSEAQARLAAVFRPEQFPAGTVIFREGEAADRLYVVARGQIALEMNVPGRGSQRILTVGPGDLLGWSPILSRGSMSVTAIATLESELLTASADILRQLCGENAEVGYVVMRNVAIALSQRLIATRLQLLDLFHQDVPMSERMMAAP